VPAQGVRGDSAKFRSDSLAGRVKAHNNYVNGKSGR
jgi:hypothetical protein